MEQMILKHHLVKLLLEEYKYDSQKGELGKLGFELSGLEVNNLAIILDIIGFPPENSFTVTEKLDADGDRVILNKRPADEDFFCRDDLFNEYYEIADQLRKKQKVTVTENGLKIVPDIEAPEVEEILLKYIDWLYEELLKLDKKNRN
jgi:hypothetical protein